MPVRGQVKAPVLPVPLSKSHSLGWGVLAGLGEEGRGREGWEGGTHVLYNKGARLEL